MPTKKKGDKEAGDATLPTPLMMSPWRIVLAEINGGRSSMLLAFAGIQHANDMLHTLGLISNDAWNNVKGTAALFASTENIASLAGSAGSVLKTLVEGEIGLEKASTRQFEAETRRIQKLAGVKSSDADEAIEG